MNRPYPWLKYLDAHAIQFPDIPIEGMRVRNDAGERLGKIEGFIVDSDSGRPYYVVVDAGGWFKSKEFLVPVGLTRLDSDHDSLVVELSKDRISRFPGFDTHEFAQLQEGDLKRLNDDICQVCSIEIISYAADEPWNAAWDRPHYEKPDWWSALPERPDRMGDNAFATQVDYPPADRDRDWRRHASLPFRA